jgi:hypothetical protein
MADFAQAFVALIGVEKGYSNDPEDPGGATCWGITERIARIHGYQGPMEQLPRSTAALIAKQDYWDRLKCDLYPQPVAYCLFDALYKVLDCRSEFDTLHRSRLELADETLQFFGDVDALYFHTHFSSFLMIKNRVEIMQINTQKPHQNG